MLKIVNCYSMLLIVQLSLYHEEENNYYTVDFHVFGYDWAYCYAIILD